MIKCAFDVLDKCAVLSEKHCEKCSFFKSREKLLEGRLKAERRIASLPDRQRQRIYDTYYSKGGKEKDARVRSKRGSMSFL